MKRDMDLIRNILLCLEESPDTVVSASNFGIDGHTGKEISYHLTLMSQADLVRGEHVVVFSGSSWVSLMLTWKGHEFLDAARDDTVWAKVKGAAAGAGGIAFDVVKSLLVAYLKERASSLLGLKISAD
jgi:hypothetical protein